MGTVVHKNQRGGQQPERVVTSGDPRKTEPVPEPTGPPVKRRLDKKAQRRRTTTAQRRHYPHGFGLFACGNCRYFHKQYKQKAGKNGCEGDGVKRTDRPCGLNSHGFGYFEPVKMPEAVTEIPIDHLSRDHLLLLEYRVRLREAETFKVSMAPYTIGTKVRVLLDDDIGYREGTVVRILKRVVRVEMDNTGAIMSFRPDDLEMAGDPMG